nr:hypothetical protein [Tanacetum cinerariifolium]
MKKDSKKKIKQMILKRIFFMLGLNIPTGIMTQAEKEDVAHTLKVMDEVEVKDVVMETRKTKFNVTPLKTDGHFVSKCPERNRNHEVNLNETQDKGVYHEEAEKGWKIHYLDVKPAFLNGNRKKLNSTLKKMGFLQCVHEKAVYRKVPNGEFIIVAIYGDDLFVTGARLDLINEFKRRMASQFKKSDLGELTYHLGIEVSQGKDCVEIKQERYAMKILKEAGMEDCNPALCPMEPGLKLSKAKDEPEVEVTQYRKMVSCLRYLLHTRSDLTYSVCVVSRYMQSPRESHARYSDSSHNVDIDDGRSTTGHVFYLGTSPITWCSQKQTTVALSSCEAELMVATSATCQAIWLRELLAEVTGLERQKMIIRVDNKSTIIIEELGLS